MEEVLTYLTEPQGIIKNPATTAQADIRKGRKKSESTSPNRKV